MAHQILVLFIMALAVACVAWTVTHEQIFLETRDYCQKRSDKGRSFLERKFFYLFTCEYCFSHYAALFFLLIAQYRLIFYDWRGAVIGFFAMVWIANLYMTIFAILRQKLKVERLEGNLKDNEWHEVKDDNEIEN